MTVPRDEFENVVRDLRNAVEQNTADLKIQFERIAQIQAELDSLRMASERASRKKKSTPLPLATAADEHR
jgi:hypothetical protein